VDEEGQNVQYGHPRLQVWGIQRSGYLADDCRVDICLLRTELKPMLGQMYEKRWLRFTWLVRIIFIHLAIPNSNRISSFCLKAGFSVATKGSEIRKHLFVFLDICTRACASTGVPCIETKCLNQLKDLQQRRGGGMMDKADLNWLVRRETSRLDACLGVIL